VLYYQAVDLDPVSLGIKVPAGPTVPDISIAGSPAYATTTIGMPSLELPDPALPPGLGESMRSTAEDAPPPVPPVPPQYLNGKDTKEHDKDKDKDKSGGKEREEERSAKEFERRPSLWFKRRTAKPT
jgi:hypothetical protein